jgi:hypothetical protein
MHEHQTTEMKTQTLQNQQLKCEYADALESILGAGTLKKLRRCM